MRWRLLRRQAASSIGTSVAIVLIVAVAAGLLTAWPRLARTTAVDEIDYRIERTPAVSRALTASTIGQAPFPGGADGGFETLLEPVADAVSASGAQLDAVTGPPEALLSVTGADDALLFEADSPLPAELYQRDLQLRATPSLADHVRMVDGTLPSPVDGDPAQGGAPPQVVLSVATAERIGVAVGDVLTLDTRSADAGGAAAGLAIEVSGVFEANDPQEAWWAHQVSGLRPAIREYPNLGRRATGAAYVDAGTAAWMLRLGGPVTTSVWVPVEPGAADPAALLAELRDVTARPVDLGRGAVARSEEIRLQSMLTAELERAFGVQRGTAAVLTLVAAGPVGITFVLLLTVSRMAVTRRRTALALVSARGASPAQMRGALALEGGALGVLAAAIGAGGALLLAPGPMVVADLALPLAAALLPALFLSTARLPSTRTGRDDLSSRSRSRWRWVAEVLLLGVTGSGVYLLLDRGLQPTTAAGVDPLATAVPLLVPFAAAVLAGRLHPLLMRVVQGLARRSRGLPAFLGSARAVRENAALLVTMLALVGGASTAVLSTTMLTTASVGVAESTRATTGADVRMVGPPYTDEATEQIRVTPGVSSVSRVNVVGATRLDLGQERRLASLLAIDTATLGPTQTGVTGALDLPGGMDRLVDGAVPVVLASALGMGDPVGLTTVVGNVEVPLVVVAVAEQAPGLTSGTDWFVVDLELLREVTGVPLTPRTVLVDVVDGADDDATAAVLRTVVDGSVETAGAASATFLASPSAAALPRGLALTATIGLLQSGLAVALVLVLAAPARHRLVDVVRTLGVSARVVRTLVAWEVVPIAAVAVVIGAGIGLALPHLIVATVDLTAFTGSAQPLVRHDLALTAALLAALVAVVLLTVTVAGALARRRFFSTLRTGGIT